MIGNDIPSYVLLNRIAYDVKAKIRSMQCDEILKLECIVLFSYELKQEQWFTFIFVEFIPDNSFPWKRSKLFLVIEVKETKIVSIREFTSMYTFKKHMANKTMLHTRHKIAEDILNSSFQEEFKYKNNYERLVDNELKEL